jgi:hypothetical protein
MPDWKKQFDDGVAEFRAQKGGTFSVCVVPASEYEELIAAGDKGDQTARQIVRSLNHWFHMADAAHDEDGTLPGCASCGVKIEPGEVCGWVVFLPHEPKQDTGLCGVFCRECLELGANTIARNTIELLQHEFGSIEVHRPH